jgi:hypothetical protein
MSARNLAGISAALSAEPAQATSMLSAQVAAGVIYNNVHTTELLKSVHVY